MVNRPVNLSLRTMAFPITAIVSILHRVSGVFLFLLIPALLYALSCSLHSEASFTSLALFFSRPVIKCMLWIFLLALVYHLLAGLRHLIMDMGMAETLKSARLSSFIVFAVFALSAILLGVWLCV